ncbi:MAG: hypothetical protein SFU53_05740 [Terrimicrobiaceae bacterium]|nr:hypothetical protein [Terrimicrobiaceae bacterium]
MGGHSDSLRLVTTFARLFLSIAFLGLLNACRTPAPDPEIPLTLRTFPTAYEERVIAVTDANRDGTVTLVEWESAGGNRRSFEIADANRDGAVTRTELRRLGSNARLFDFTKSYADVNKDSQLTPREFRTASGVRVLHLDF